MGKGAVGADKSSYETSVYTRTTSFGSRRLYRRHHPELGGTRTIRSRSSPKLRNYMPNVPKNWKQSLRNAMRPKQNGRKLIRNWPPRWICGSQAKAPVIDWKAIEQKPNQATRAASATVLGVLATQVENMIVSSADLSNSDKTDGFLKKTHAFVKGDFSVHSFKPVLPN